VRRQVLIRPNWIEVARSEGRLFLQNYGCRIIKDILIFKSRHADINTYRHTDIQTYGQTDRQAGRQTDRQTYIYIYL